jgi:FkbM family methyltransferase
MSETKAVWSFGEQLTHAVRVRSVQGAIVALSGATIGRIAPRWWKEKAPWYVGRSLDTLHLKATTDGGHFTVPAGPGATSFRGLLWLGAYERLERYAICRWLPPSLPVVELGAAIGVVSCLTNRRLTEPDWHVCVEANPNVIPILEENRRLNGARFKIVHSAVAYGGETVTFGASDAVVDSSVKGSESTKPVVVPATRLSDVINDAGFTTCSLVCDIEGAERELIANESAVLRDAVHTLITEVHPDILGADVVADLHRQLLGLGFQSKWERGNVWVLSKS